MGVGVYRGAYRLLVTHSCAVWDSGFVEVHTTVKAKGVFCTRYTHGKSAVGIIQKMPTANLTCSFYFCE